ncbi:hypothetical protein RND71_023308 [Anisodus tanguticus]|uniref:Uncharacterized protein n=1 Tax=Anisodus tanguticus TaxID=243964 RepID=A0AAE1V5Y5_9SOLA|nr:hypothetical protein RND71_023308 [Anisodus tanguticus]
MMSQSTEKDQRKMNVVSSESLLNAGMNTAAQSEDPKSYDDLGCLRNLNNLTIFKDNLLEGDLESLRNEYPSDVVILYVDYYAAFQTLLCRVPFFGKLALF